MTLGYGLSYWTAALTPFTGPVRGPEDPTPARPEKEDTAMPIDLDAARAARREATHETPKAVFGGREFTLPDELPFGVFVHLADLQADPAGAGAGAVTAILETLFGDQAEDFLKLGPSTSDVIYLVEAAAELYGSSLGEAEASEPS